MQDQVNKSIKGTPTKDLFISMLIRDLTLKDAIGDLVDNSVDGAKSIKEDGDYSDLWINITATNEEFVIADNCGGIAVQTARDYAFRFGRPKDTPQTKGSIGQFGIGMKRALFKLGNVFEIKSVASNSSFTMKVNVGDWRDVENNWDFEFDQLEEGVQENPVEDRGTIITVTELRDDVKSLFSDNNFIKKLKTEIELEHLYLSLIHI